ncbi:MAG: hypothetical protein HY069_03365 [Chlamydiia bacterium]|nr:hypothetical protein [Chlamydiia bacterium]
MPRRRPDFEPGEAASKQLNFNKLSDADGLKRGGCPTPAEPIFESRSVYKPSNFSCFFKWCCARLS